MSNHIQDLMPNPVIPLYELLLINGTTIRLTDREEVTYQGNSYEVLPISLTGDGNTSSGEKVRPKLSLINPDGVLSALVRSGLLEGGKLTRSLVSLGDLGLDLLKLDIWYIYQITALNRALVELELRAISDYPQTVLPPRKYYPPEFTHVTL